jgi:hypothetical protein
MRSFKLLLFLAGGGIILLLIVAMLFTFGRSMGQFFFGRSFAEAQLRDYVQTVLKKELNGARCQAVDSDNNNYVSCEYTVVSQTDDTPRSVECAAWGWSGFVNRGCRTRLPNYR